MGKANRKDSWGRTVSDADERFFQLRESGWKGPIDQDGHKVTEGETYDALKRLAESRGVDTSDW